MKVIIADKSHSIYASAICETISEAAQVRGTGIAKRTSEYVIEKMEKGNAVIALDGETFAGFCYIESWGHGKFVANSGLIVHPDYRGQGLAKKIKKVVLLFMILIVVSACSEEKVESKNMEQIYKEEGVPVKVTKIEKKKFEQDLLTSKKEVTAELVYEVVSNMTKIPISNINLDEIFKNEIFYFNYIF